MTAAASWPARTLPVLALLAAAQGLPAVAAVDSPRLDQVTCQSLRVRQTGLPLSTPLVVKVTDPASGHQFARQETSSDRAGVLDTRIAAGFAGAGQLVVEVEAERGGQEVEFAEAVHEFDRPCPAAPAAGRLGQRTRAAVAAVVAAVTVAVLVLVVAGRVLRLLRHGGRG
jgi:hypothetical protein